VSGSDRDSEKVRDSINPDTVRYAFPAGASASGEHCYSDVTETFQVRGVEYLADRVKIDGGDAIFDLMHVDMFRCAEKIGNVAARSDSWLRSARAAGDTRYYLNVVYVTPASPHLHMSFYYAVQPSRLAANPHFSSLWQQFTAHGPEADAFRNERWKVIPRIAEGPWAVSYAVGTKPALLAQKLTHTWVICDGSAPEERARSQSGGGVESVGNQDASCGSSMALGMGQGGGTSISDAEGPGPYLEADCDVASSSMAFMLVSLLQSSARCVLRPPRAPRRPPSPPHPSRAGTSSSTLPSRSSRGRRSACLRSSWAPSAYRASTWDGHQ
jgi:hypothetical protein